MEEQLDLLNWMEQVRVGLRHLAREAPPDMEITPGWTVKEVLCHISGWDLVTEKALRAHLDGGVYLLETMDIDACNREMVAKRCGLSRDEIVEDWEQSRRLLISAIESLSGSDFEREIIFPWGEEGTIMEMLEIIAGHEQEHSEEIARQIG
jgi:hypothetical protein